MSTEEHNDDLPIDAPERKRLPLLLRRAWYGLNQAFRRRTRLLYTSDAADE